MEANTPSNEQSKQVTVDVPEDRLAEFNYFVERFLAGPSGRGRRRGHRRSRHGHGGPRGRRCAERREASEQSDATTQPSGTTEL